MDVPAQLAARARLLNTGHARKTDPIDAAAVAMVAQHHRRLHPVRAEDDSLVLRLLFASDDAAFITGQTFWVDGGLIRS